MSSPQLRSGFLAAVGALFAGVVGATTKGALAASSSNVPAGTIVAFWPSGKPLIPHGWVPCDGTDHRAPDLRKLFLRGVAIPDFDGKTSGSDDHVHSFSGTTGQATGGSNYHAEGGNPPQATGTDHSHAYSGSTAGGANVPQHMPVIYIMKV